MPTRWPPPRWRKCSTARVAMAVNPATFTAIVSASGAHSSDGFSLPVPADITNKSTPPSRSIKSVARNRDSAVSFKSSRAISLIPGCSAATCLSASSRRAAIPTAYPNRASCTAMAAPIPDEAPTTTAVRAKDRLLHCENEEFEQLAANRLTIPQDAIVSLLQRVVRHCRKSFLIGPIPRTLHDSTRPLQVE